MKSKAVIFDMDGVIIDSEGLWRQAQKDALAGWGVTVNDEECETLTKGKRLDEIARVWCEYCPLQTDPGVLSRPFANALPDLLQRKAKRWTASTRYCIIFATGGIGLRWLRHHPIRLLRLLSLNLISGGILTSFAALTMNATANRTRRCISPR